MKLRILAIFSFLVLAACTTGKDNQPQSITDTGPQPSYVQPNNDAMTNAHKMF